MLELVADNRPQPERRTIIASSQLKNAPIPVREGVIYDAIATVEGDWTVRDDADLGTTVDGATLALAGARSDARRLALEALARMEAQIQFETGCTIRHQTRPQITYRTVSRERDDFGYFTNWTSRVEAVATLSFTCAAQNAA